ncbi:MAG: ABC transporter ATP-binding protein [Thermoplasmata archaeon]
MSEPILRIDGLSAEYVVGAGRFRALSDVTFEMRPREVVGIVGETGCGKSTLGHAIPRLLPEPPARILGGRIVYRGTDLLTVPKWRMPTVRGTEIGMIFQEPINSLNPAYRILSQVAEAVAIRHARESGRTPRFTPLEPHDYTERPPHDIASHLVNAFVPTPPSGTPGRPRSVPLPKRADLRTEVLEFLRLVRINDPETILDLYPHELSGGMRQRIMIAMALSAKPSLLIADEPTSALDVTIQAQVLTLMKELMDEVDTSILFISHDLGVIAEIADQVGVMYAGHLVEFGPVEDVFERPHHPYTKALLRSVPNRYKSDGALPSLPGSVPNLSRLPAGCTFHPRCPIARPVCGADPAPPFAVHDREHPAHRASCHFALDVGGRA